MVVPPAVVEKILNYFSQSSLCSYQIAYRCKLRQPSIVKIIKSHLGSEFYTRKEQLALDRLYRQMQEMVARNISGDEIADRLGLCRATCFTILRQLNANIHTVTSSNPDKVYQLDSIDDLDKLDFTAVPAVPAQVEAESKSELIVKEPVDKTDYPPAAAPVELSEELYSCVSTPKLMKLEYQGVKLTLDLNVVPKSLTQQIIQCLTQS